MPGTIIDIRFILVKKMYDDMILVLIFYCGYYMESYEYMRAVRKYSTM